MSVVERAPTDHATPHQVVIIIVIVGGGAGGLELATRLGDTLAKRQPDARFDRWLSEILTEQAASH